MQITKLYFQVMVRDIPRTAAFYQKVFGFELKRATTHRAELAMGTATLMLQGGGTGAPTPTGLGFEVDDLKAACAAVKAAGGTLVTPPMGRPGESTVSATAADPDGNRFMLAQPRK